MPNTLYTVATLAARWGTSTTFIYALVNAGALPAFRLGGKLIRIKQSEVEAYECQNHTASVN